MTLGPSIKAALCLHSTREKLPAVLSGSASLLQQWNLRASGLSEAAKRCGVQLRPSLTLSAQKSSRSVILLSALFCWASIARRREESFAFEQEERFRSSKPMLAACSASWASSDSTESKLVSARHTASTLLWSYASTYPQERTPKRNSERQASFQEWQMAGLLSPPCPAGLE